MFEGTSFYFVRKMPVAFRPPVDSLLSQKHVFIRDTKFGKEAQNFIETLSLVSYGRKTTTNTVKPEIFKEILEKAYNNALFDGVKRIARQRMHIDDQNFDWPDPTEIDYDPDIT